MFFQIFFFYKTRAVLPPVIFLRYVECVASAKSYRDIPNLNSNHYYTPSFTKSIPSSTHLLLLRNLPLKLKPESNLGGLCSIGRWCRAFSENSLAGDRELVDSSGMIMQQRGHGD
jgi:hypothetical protein